jgi:hypothetical protein
VSTSGTEKRKFERSNSQRKQGETVKMLDEKEKTEESEDSQDS